jgi:steroid delta-isomerase-like uncharacterized protein
MATAPPPTASNAELVRWAFEDCLNSRDVTPLRAFWNDDTVERFPDRTCHGADAIVAYFDEVFAALPDFHMEVRDLIGEGDHVFVHWRLTGTHRGTFSGIEATGRRLELDGMDHFVFRDGRVVSNFVVFDQMQFARALGLLPPDGSAADRAMKAAFNAKNRLTERLRAARG